MDRRRALLLLELSDADAADPDVLRRAYRRRMREVHPDLNPGAGAAEMTVSISRAYRLLADPSPPTRTGRETQGPGGVADRGAAPREEPRQPGSRRVRGEHPRLRRLRVEVLDESSILVAQDRESTFAALLEAAHSLGEIGYLDRSAWLVEVLVEFVEAPTSSVVMTLQGRARGTEVFCTVEPLSGGDSPPIGPVTRIVAEALAAL